MESQIKTLISNLAFSISPLIHGDEASATESSNLEDFNIEPIDSTKRKKALEKMRTVTIVITGHDEGDTIYRALNSAEINARLARDFVKSQIVIVLDKADQRTIEVGQEIIQSERARVVTHDFGDLSMSRNAAINEARSAFILFLDADDVWSENFLLKGVESLQASNSRIVLPEELRFLGKNLFGSFLVKRKLRIFSPPKRFRKLLTRNWLPATFLAYRDVFEKFPFIPNDYEHKWGFEDWNFHLRIAIAEVPVSTAQDTYLEIYQRPGSLGRISRKKGLDMNPRLRP